MIFFKMKPAFLLFFLGCPLGSVPHLIYTRHMFLLCGTVVTTKEGGGEMAGGSDVRINLARSRVA